MQILSTIVFHVDTTPAQQNLVKMISSFLRADRGDWIEEKILSRPHPDGGEETTIYVIVHTGNIQEMIRELDHLLPR